MAETTAIRKRVNVTKIKAEAVNVASVPQLSLFRYPGGKTWLVPYLRQWLAKSKPVAHLVEPFAGGGVISLTAVSETLAENATLVEKDRHVAAVWATVLNGGADWLAERITSFQVSLDNIKPILATESEVLYERAFATILRNRVQRGGILAPGAGLLKEGENGRGLLSRWYPETLKNRILAIQKVKDRLSFIEGDGVAVIKQYAAEPGAVFFIDPPYTVAGRRLYTHSEIDHAELFKVLSGVAGDILMTYDDCKEIRKLAKGFGFQAKLVRMKSTHHAEKYELLIGKDLSWLAGLRV